MTPEEKRLKDSIKEWGTIQKNRMVQRVISLQLRDKIALKKRVWNMNNTEGYKPLAGSLGFGIRSENGLVNRINYVFSKHGIFFEHGVGRGRPVGSGEAKPNPFLGVVLDAALNDLADRISEAEADMVVSEIKFFVPGIIDRRIVINNNG